MEWLATVLTSAAAGAAAGEMLLGKRIGNQALAWGAGIAFAPCLLEGMAGAFLSNSADLVCHAALAHSLWSAALVAALLPKWLAPEWKKARVSRQRLAWFAGLAWAMPALWKCLGTPGAQLCWPVPCPRLALGLVDPGDAVPGILLACALASLLLLRTKKQQPKRRRRWWWGVGLAGGYLALMATTKWIAGAGFRADLARRGVVPTGQCTCPTAWNPLLWRGLARCGDEIWLGERSVWEWPSTPVRWIAVPSGAETGQASANLREFARIDAVTAGWWLHRPNKTGCWMADLRAGTHRVWGERKGMVDLRFRRAWQIEPEQGGDPLRILRPESKGAGDQFKRLARRSFADRAACDGLPRLAGVPGALPEPLRTVD
jgi:inner membrane protein